jgi:DNA polymerase-3 subunit delta'
VPTAPLYGHAALRARLAGAASRGSLPASLLLHGSRGIGKQRLALWLGQTLLCSADGERPCGTCANCRYATQLAHPDLRWVFPRPRLKDAAASPTEVMQDYADAIAERVKDGFLYPPAAGTEAIYLATVRALVQFAAITPAVAQRKVIVIGDAERLVPQQGAEDAANAVLKLLEEPPADTTVILTSSEPGALLPTIRSRLIAIRVAPLSDSEVGAFVRDPTVKAALDERGLPTADVERVRLAHGAPGTLLGTSATALSAARALLDAATSVRASDRYRSAVAQGASGARGTFTDMLDALTIVLGERTRAAVRREDLREARAAAQAIAAVESAKARAAGNGSPQLIAAALLRSLAPVGADRTAA